MKHSVFVLLLMVAACASVTTSYDYDKSADFKKGMTYNWDKHVQDLAIDQLNKTRIINAVEKEMAARGYTKSDNPDFLVDLHVKLQQEESATATTTGPGGYGRWGYGWGGGFSTTTVDVNKYVDGTLFINVIDKATEKIIWQGRGEKTVDDKLSPEKRDEQINAAVASIFKQYPIAAPSTKK
ncbi:MAG: DUF4136 domain-containing protein [Chryseolinea sp.]